MFRLISHCLEISSSTANNFEVRTSNGVKELSKYRNINAIGYLL